MLTPFLGILCLAGVLFVALNESPAAKLSFFDFHAAVVVVGGVVGSLLLAIDRHSLWRMLMSARELLPQASSFSREIRATQVGVEEMKKAWREGRRAMILEMADRGATPDLRVAADTLLRQVPGATLEEEFTRLRAGYMHNYLPVIEGWEMVGKLAPSFGMVGTVTGMVMLFRNMAENSGNLGGAMAMALLATLYGISLGAAVGGPMASRVNTQLNERLTLIDLMEKTVAALIADGGGRPGEGAHAS